jgi:hypothetical protein
MEDKGIVKILVKVNMQEGILENLEIEWGTWKYVWKIDYWKMPFLCAIFHEVGPLQK